MKLDIAVHQVATSYVQALMGPSDEDPDPDTVDPQDVIGGIYGKVLDGVNWMDRFDTHPNAITGWGSARLRAIDHGKLGRRWVPWGNVTGHAPIEEGRLAAQAAVAAQQGRVSSDFDQSLGVTYIANVEPYPQFWPHRGADSRRRTRQFLDSFVAEGGEHLWLWVDARAWQLAETEGIGFDNWYSYRPSLVDRVLPEVYWTDFGMRSNEALERAARLLAAKYRVPLDQIHPTFPGDARPADLVGATIWAHEKGLGRPNIWQRLNLTLEGAIALARMDDLWEPTPEPDPPPVAPDVVVAYRDAQANATLLQIAGGQNQEALDTLGRVLGIEN